MGNPQKGKDKDKNKEATDTLNTIVFDPNDVQIHSFFMKENQKVKN